MILIDIVCVYRILYIMVDWWPRSSPNGLFQARKAFRVHIWALPNDQFVQALFSHDFLHQLKPLQSSASLLHVRLGSHNHHTFANFASKGGEQGEQRLSEVQIVVGHGFLFGVKMKSQIYSIFKIISSNTEYYMVLRKLEHDLWLAAKIQTPGTSPASTQLLRLEVSQLLPTSQSPPWWSVRASHPGPWRPG